MKTILFIALISLAASPVKQSKTEIDYEEVNISCIRNNVKECAINTKAEFRKLSSSYPLPDIDFNRHTLICINYGVAGCTAPDVDLHVYRMPDGSCRVETKITQHGICKRLNHGKKCLLIPKVNNPDKIAFYKTVVVNRK
ncbi:MAG: hypothetical protein ACQES1_05245 [Bacteroidota bacterium]